MELTPYVSNEEQKEIEIIAGNPEDYDKGIGSMIHNVIILLLSFV